MLDISDGLVGDIKHICEQSHCGAEIELEALPYHHSLNELSQALLYEAVLAGGDDYELCFTAPQSGRHHIALIGSELGLTMARVGRLCEGDAVVYLLDAQGNQLTTNYTGFDHFKEPS